MCFCTVSLGPGLGRAGVYPDVVPGERALTLGNIEALFLSLGGAGPSQGPGALSLIRQEQVIRWVV